MTPTCASCGGTTPDPRPDMRRVTDNRIRHKAGCAIVAARKGRRREDGGHG